MNPGSSSLRSTGTFYGVGVGPGDPELLTLKARRLIRQCALITYLQSEYGNSMAREIAAPALGGEGNPHQKEHAILVPMCDNREATNRVYDAAARLISENLDNGKDVVFLCQGDPFFFGSFAYLHDRLNNRYAIEVVPGISSISASAALTGRPLALLAENMAVISGRRGDEDILKTLVQFDNIAIMKPGRRRECILALIHQSGRTADTCYVEYAGQENQRIVRDITRLEPGQGPYFSVFLVTRKRDDGNR